MTSKARKRIPRKQSLKMARKKRDRKPVAKNIATAQQSERSIRPQSAIGSEQGAPGNVEPSPELRRIKAAYRKRWRELANSKEFIQETASLKWKFNRVYQDDPDLVKQFFRPAFGLTLGNLQQLDRTIQKIRDEQFRSLLRRYMDYAIGFGVEFKLFKSPPCFRVQDGIATVEDRFRVVLRNGDFLQGGGPDAVFPEGFESSVRATPRELETLVKDGLARYVQIDDEDRFSPFRQMFLFAHSHNQVTAFRYNSVPRYTLFLIGQNVSLAKVWPELRKVVAAEQRSAARRDRRGAPAEVRRLQAMLNTILRGRVSQYSMAARFVRQKNSDGYGQRLASMESRISQLKKQLDQ